MKSKNIKNKLKNSISGQILLWLTISLLIYTFIIIAIVYVEVEKKLIQDERKIVELENSHHLQKINLPKEFKNKVHIAINKYLNPTFAAE